MKLDELFACHEEVLLEGKIERIIEKHQVAILKAFSKESPDVVGNVNHIMNEFKETHPKYIQWITNRYIKGEFIMENLPELKMKLEEFDKIKDKLQSNEKDINRHKTLESFYKVITG